MNERTTTPPLSVTTADMPAWVKSYPLNVTYEDKRMKMFARSYRHEHPIQPRERNPIIEPKIYI